MAPFPGIISHLAVTLNKMGHNSLGPKPCQQLGLPLGVEAEQGSYLPPRALNSVSLQPSLPHVR